MSTERSPRARRRLASHVLQILFIAAGAVAGSIGIAGLLGTVAIDAAGALFLVVLGAVWVLGGIFKLDVIEHML